MEWEKSLEEEFNLIISKIPIFHRRIAESAVKNRAEDNASKRNSGLVQEQDLANAFFSDVPKPFYSMMVRLLDEAGFDYRKYGYPR